MRAVAWPWPLAGNDMSRLHQWTLIAFLLVAILTLGQHVRRIVRSPAAVGISCISFSHDTAYIAFGARDGRFELWELHAPRRHFALQEGRSAVVGVSFRNGASEVMWADAEGVVRCADVRTGRTRHVLRHSGVVSAMAVAPDASSIAIASESDVFLYSIVSAQLEEVFRGHVHRVASLAFSPDGRYLASADDLYDRMYPPSVIKIWDLDEGSDVATMESPGGGITSIAFSPDGAHVLSGNRHGSGSRWNLIDENHTTLGTHSKFQHVRALNVAGSVPIAVTASGVLDWHTSEVKLWQTQAARQLQTLGPGEHWWALSTAISHDGVFVASGDGRGTVRVWELNSEFHAAQLRMRITRP